MSRLVALDPRDAARSQRLGTCERRYEVLARHHERRKAVAEHERLRASSAAPMRARGRRARPSPSLPVPAPRKLRVLSPHSPRHDLAHGAHVLVRVKNGWSSFVASERVAARLRPWPWWPIPAATSAPSECAPQCRPPLCELLQRVDLGARYNRAAFRRRRLLSRATSLVGTLQLELHHAFATRGAERDDRACAENFGREKEFRSENKRFAIKSIQAWSSRPLCPHHCCDLRTVCTERRATL